jgi:hypothetical protein
VRVDTAFVLMPKAASHLNYFHQTRKDYVGLSRQNRWMETKTIAHRMKDSSYFNLWSRVLALDLAHVPAAPKFGESVCHGSRE